MGNTRKALPYVVFLFVAILICVTYPKNSFAETSPAYLCAKQGPGLIEIRVHRFLRHTGILLKTALISKEELPEIADFKEVPFVDISYGDEEIFHSLLSKETIWMDLKSLFLERPVVLRLRGFDEIIEESTLRVLVSKEGFASLIKFIGRSFERDFNGASIELAQKGLMFGVYTGRYYRARNHLSIPHTCNKWTAYALNAAGCKIQKEVLLSSDQVWEEVRRLPGTILLPG